MLFRKLGVALAGVSLLGSILAGCSGSADEEGLKELGKDETATIKVMFYDENYFFQQYGSLFISKFPNIDVEVVNLQSLYRQGLNDDSLRKFIDDNKPDVLMLSLDQYEKLAQDGRLYELDAVIQQDKYDTEGIQPAILKLLRDKGNGKLYGFSPTFSNNALYYNKDLFAKYGVEPPRDSMSWSEVLELAKRFPTDGDKDDRVYGYGISQSYSYYDMVWQISQTDNLRTVSPDGTKLTVSGDGWKNVLSTVADAASSNAVLFPESEQMQNGMTMQDYYMQDPFIAGKVAMMLDYPYKVQNIEGAKQSVESAKDLQWGIVTAPVDPNNRNQGKSFSVNNIFAVNAQSSNLRAAWEFVKYASGGDYARVKSKSGGSGELLSRIDYNKERDGVSMEPFYKLEPATDMTTGWENAPDNLYGVLRDLMNENIQSIVDGKETADEALAAIQEKGQAALDEGNRQKKEKEQKKAAESGAEASAQASEEPVSGSSAPSASAE